MECRILKGHTFPEVHSLCVVIDVLRAFTTAAFAFASGAKQITFVSSPEEAFKKHQKDPSLLLMGEVEGRRIEGFHFENSPAELQNAQLCGRKLVQRTSSGTQGVVGCQQASHILIASIVVAEATVKRILEIKPSHVFLIATGQNNGDEDVAFAEYLQSQLCGKSFTVEKMVHRVRTSPVAKRMIGNLEYPHGPLDLELALKLDHFPFAMEVFKEDEELIGRPVFYPKDARKLGPLGPR